MISFIGLGNYDPRYYQTRHNIGMYLVKDFGKKYPIKSHKEYTEFNLVNQNLSMYIPHSLMNICGKPILKILLEKKICPCTLFIIHDDLETDIGKSAIKLDNGSLKGHNGLKDIYRILEQNKNYLHLCSKCKLIDRFYPNRIKIGIGRPENKELVAQYVLEKVPSEQWQLLISVGQNAMISIIKSHFNLF